MRISFKCPVALKSDPMGAYGGYFRQRSTEGRRSTAVAEGFSPTATASAAEGLKGRRPKFWPKAKIFKKYAKIVRKLG